MVIFIIFFSFKLKRKLSVSSLGLFLQAESPGGNVVSTMKGTSGDKFEFKAPRSGMYKFCFHNPHSAPETVSFYIHVGHIPNDHDLAKDGLFLSFFEYFYRHLYRI